MRASAEVRAQDTRARKQYHEPTPNPPGLAYAVRQLFEWVLKFPHTRRCGERTIARRFLALVWTINPAMIENSPSLSAIAKDLRITKAALSVHSAMARRQFGIQNRAQCRQEEVIVWWEFDKSNRNWKMLA